ncbi:MAG: hypothetical protein ACRCTZ_11580 [Sarcina sp.]
MNKKTSKKKSKKTHFNFFKFLRNMSILAIVIFAVYWIISSLFAAPPKPLPKVVSTPTKTVAPPAPVNPVVEYKAKQYKIFVSIFRFNENLYMSMSTNNVVNLYPDSQNAVSALNDNLSAFASKLNSADVRSESLFLNQLTQKNNAYINSVIAFNKEALLKTPNQKTLQELQKTVLENYNTINKFMNDNLSVFK